MDLSVYDWVYQIIVEGIKYILIAHYFLGFAFAKRKTAYLLFLYLALIPAVEYSDDSEPEPLRIIHLPLNCPHRCKTRSA